MSSVAAADEGIEALANGVIAADKPSVAAALNRVEDRRLESRPKMAELLEYLAAKGPVGGHRIGITGPPGVGKSTLAHRLAEALRAQHRTVGVVAVDPSSLRSGGSLLGDRARMAFDPRDPGLFVRSLATGGALGGLSWAVNASVRVLSAAYECVLVETTGVGQSEVDVSLVSDTVVLVVQPGSGDVLQFLKAGIMEIPDVFVINKADQSQIAARAVSDLKMAMHTLASAAATSALTATPIEPAILSTSARDGTGISELVEALDAHYRRVRPHVAERRRAGDIAWTRRLFEHAHGTHGVAQLGGDTALHQTIETRLTDGATPVALADELGKAYLAKG